MLPMCRTKALARWLAILERSGFASQVGQLHAGTNHCTVRVRDACGMHRAAPDRCLGYLDDTGEKKLEEVCGQVLCMSSVSSLGRALMWCCSGSSVDRPRLIQVSLSQERLDERGVP